MKHKEIQHLRSLATVTIVFSHTRQETDILEVSLMATPQLCLPGFGLHVHPS